METLGHAKGSLVSHLRDYAVKIRGTEAWMRSLKTLPLADRELFEGVLLASGWYSVGTYNRALEAFMSQHVSDVGAEMRSFAEFVAHEDLNSFFKTLLKIATPEMLLRRTNSLWTRYFDTGELRVVHDAPGAFALALEAPTDEDCGPSALTCGDGVCGWISHGLTLTGARHVKVTELACRFHGGSECSYRAVWG